MHLLIFYGFIAFVAFLALRRILESVDRYQESKNDGSWINDHPKREEKSNEPPSKNDEWLV